MEFVSLPYSTAIFWFIRRRLLPFALLYIACAGYQRSDAGLHKFPPVITSVRQIAQTAILDAIGQKTEMPATILAQRIERAIAEKAVERRTVRQVVARIIFTIRIGKTFATHFFKIKNQNKETL
jgi:hypothetical protein